MKENNKNQPQNFKLPPLWCAGICRNAMNEICVESCAIENDMSGFDPKLNLSLLEMPRFPIKVSSEMTKEEKFKIVAIYLSKIVDYLQGNENENTSPTLGRLNINRARSGSLSETFKVEDILSSLKETDSVSEVGTQRENQTIRSSEVVDPTD